MFVRLFVSFVYFLRKTVAVMVQLNLDPRVWEKCLDHRAGQL